jgi:hypothetical protein
MPRCRATRRSRNGVGASFAGGDAAAEFVEKVLQEDYMISCLLSLVILNRDQRSDASAVGGEIKVLE